jgi:hypothetical protein
VPQNFTECAYKLFSSFENLFSRLDNIFSRLGNNYITSIEDFYAVFWGGLYRVL